MSSSSLSRYIRSLASSHSVEDVIRRIRSKRYSRTYNARKKEKFLRGHVWDAYDNMFNLNTIMNNDNKIFFGSFRC